MKMTDDEIREELDIIFADGYMSGWGGLNEDGESQYEEGFDEERVKNNLLEFVKRFIEDKDEIQGTKE